jgi:hypothetical protein
VEHLWQVRLVAPPLKWVTLGVRFADLALTRRGRVEANQQPINRATVNGVSERLRARGDVGGRMGAQRPRHCRHHAPTSPHPPPSPHPPAQFGVLLADGTNGPFKFEVQFLRAARVISTAEFMSVPEQVLAEARRVQGALAVAGKTPEELGKAAALTAHRAKLEAAKTPSAA